MKQRNRICILGVLWTVGAMLYGQGHGDVIQVCTAANNQGFAQVEYNVNADVYLSAWEDPRKAGWDDVDIYGQLIKGDGTLIGENFAVCGSAGHQYWPHIAVDPERNLFLVVFEDQRNGSNNGDVRGVFIDTQGNFVDAPASEADHTFGICTISAHIYTCSVAYNYIDDVYLAVWGDNRNNAEFWYPCVDVYGQLIGGDGTLISPLNSQDTDTNFAIDKADWYEASVPDVTYNEITDEFFVVYGTGIGYVLSQRVDHQGQLIQPDGIPAAAMAKPGGANSVLPASLVSGKYNNGPDCFQTKACARLEYFGTPLKKTLAQEKTEVQVIWKGMTDLTPAENFNDGWGQRIGFFLEGNKYVQKYVSLNGDSSSLNNSNFPLSLQPDWIDVLDIAYSGQDDEFLVSWGDPRSDATQGMDLFMQRLGIQNTESMLFLADDRVNTVTETQNIPLITSGVDEGSLLGVAHNPKRNEFLIVYVTDNMSMGSGADIMAIQVYGSEATRVSQQEQRIETFALAGNYPNPFNPSTTIRFALPQAAPVKVRIYDLRGQSIATLLDASLPSGSHSIQWNGTNHQGLEVASGIYVVEIQANQNVRSSKMMLMR